jgi:hypothetical protein
MEGVADAMEKNSRQALKKKLGQLLLILSFAIYGIVLLVPFAPLSAGRKILSSSILVILAEASFWVALLILGRQFISDYKKIGWRGWLKSGMSMPEGQENAVKTDLCDGRIQSSSQHGPAEMQEEGCKR